MGAFDHVSFSHTLGWGFEDSALVGWVCFAFRVQAVMIAAPIAGLILLDLVAYVLMRTLHISARRVRVRAAPSPVSPAMVALPPSPTLAPDALPADGELIELQPIAEPPAPTQPVPVAAASITLVDGDRSPPTSLNMSSTSPSSSSSHHSADWTHVKPPPLVSYGSAFSGVSSTSSCSSISNASFSSSDAPIGGLGLSGTGSKQLSSVALDSLLSASSSSARSSGASKAQRRGVSSLALSPMPVPGSAEEDDDDGHITPTSTAASSPAPSRMTTPGLRHKALPPLTGPSQAPNLDEGEPDLPMDDVAQSAKHSRARAGSVGVDGPLGFDGDEEDEGEESDDECGSSGTEASAAYASERGAGLRRRTTIRA